MHQLPIFEGARLGLVRVTDKINRLTGAFGEETPFQPAGETSAAPATDFTVLDLIDNFFRFQAQRLAQRGIAAHLFVIRQRTGIARLGKIREQDALFEWMRRERRRQRLSIELTGGLNPFENGIQFFRSDTLEGLIVNHHRRTGAAEGETFDRGNGE